MNVKDIMIGDFVEYNSQITKVIGISSDGFIDVTGEFENVAIGTVQPIPITPEILEKNGFTYEKVFNCYSNEYANIRFVEKNGRLTATIITDIASVMISIRYVHELQHALRLCKIDKEIVL